MNSFKEWLSDYLRYFILVLAVLLAAGVIVMGVQLYKSTESAKQAQADPNNIVILNETETEENVTETQSQKEAEETETEKETETEAETETETRKGVNAKPEPETAEKDTEETERAEQEETASETAQTQTSESAAAGTIHNAGSQDDIIVLTESQRDTAETSAAVQTEAPQTEPPQTEAPQTEPPTEVYEPVYLTMTGTCYFRSYADYGDNIIGEYPAGTVVEFLEDVGGWYKVQVDGMVGYMGARFFR